MNQTKMLAWAKKFVLNGLHTMSGTSQKETTDVSPEIEKTGAIKACNQRKTRNKDAMETYLQLNPNKLKGKNTLITKYSEFQEAFLTILKGVGLNEDEFNITRADMCFNSTDESDYAAYQKMHKLLILCIAEAYSFRNTYQSHDIWTTETLSIAIKNDSYEIENYDKDSESEHRDESKCRLELRSKRLKDKDLNHEFTELWINKLQSAIEQFEVVQQHCNMELERLYKEDLNRPKKERRYLNLTSFLLQYQEQIFCTSQMVDLLSRFDEVENPVNRAKKFKNNHAIEYFSKSNLKYIVKMIEEKSRQYFNS